MIGMPWPTARGTEVAFLSRIRFTIESGLDIIQGNSCPVNVSYSSAQPREE